MSPISRGALAAFFLAIGLATTTAWAAEPSDQCADEALAPQQRLQACTEAIRATPTSETITQMILHEQRATLHLRAGATRNAIRDLDAAIGFHPTQSLFANRALAHHALGNWDQAESDYDQATQTHPRAPYAFAFRGRFLLERGKFERAYRDFDTALKRGGESAELFYWRARALDALGRKEEAIRSYDLSLSILKTPQAFLFRGSAHLVLGNHELAIADLGNATSLPPQAAVVAFVNRGIAYLHLSRHELAEQDLSRAIAIDPLMPGAFVNRGLVYTMMGAFDRALADYGRAIQIEPRNVAAYDGRARALRGQGNIDGAIRDHLKALRLQPNNSAIHLSYAVTLFVAGDFEKAASELDQAHELGDDTVYTALWRHVAHQRANSADDSILANAGNETDLSAWPGIILDSAQDTPPPSALELQRRMRWLFFQAQTRLVDGAISGARELLEEVVARAPVSHQVYAPAKAELARLD